MEQELITIFVKAINAHFPAKTGIAKDDYLDRFKIVLAREMTDAPQTTIQIHKVIFKRNQ